MPRIAVSMPAGWTADGDLLLKNYAPDLNPGELDASDAGAGPSLVAWQISGTFVDPCTDHTLVKPTPGPGIDALADALAHQPGTTAGPPTAVTVDGYSGKFVELTVTADITKCGDKFWIWASADGNSRFVQGTNEMNRMYILDVEGRRFTSAPGFRRARRPRIERSSRRSSPRSISSPDPPPRSERGADPLSISPPRRSRWRGGARSASRPRARREPRRPIERLGQTTGPVGAGPKLELDRCGD